MKDNIFLRCGTTSPRTWVLRRPKMDGCTNAALQSNDARPDSFGELHSAVGTLRAAPAVCHRAGLPRQSDERGRERDAVERTKRLPQARGPGGSANHETQPDGL